MRRIERKLLLDSKYLLIEHKIVVFIKWPRFFQLRKKVCKKRRNDPDRTPDRLQCCFYLKNFRVALIFSKGDLQLEAKVCGQLKKKN